MNVARGNLHGHNLFRVLINPEMQFAPGPPPATSMLLDVPLPCSEDTKPGRINDNVTRPPAG